MTRDDPAPPKTPGAGYVFAVAVITAACTAAATELGKWAIEAIKARTQTKTKDE
jgi:hypothetical protein